MSHDEVYKIGRLGKPHGVKGELNFMFDDDIFDQVDADYIIVETEGILVPFFFEEYRFRSEQLAIIKLEGIDSQEQARELTNCDVFFERRLANSQPSASNNQIIGFKVINADTGETVGTVSHIDDSTLNVLFDVKTNDGRNVLIPANDNLICDINFDNLTITTHIPDGLLEL